VGNGPKRKLSRIRKARSRRLHHADNAIQNKRIAVRADFQHVFARVRLWRAMENSNKLFSAFSSLADTVSHRLRGNTLAGSRRNISYHYDLGNDFYRLFLDPSMAYSCAYFQTLNDSLEQAQLNKFEGICRKLNLKETDHLLEIGTGWGGFAAYAATHHGCRITTTSKLR